MIVAIEEHGPSLLGVEFGSGDIPAKFHGPSIRHNRVHRCHTMHRSSAMFLGNYDTPFSAYHTYGHMPAKKLTTKIHFNQNNMRQGNPRVWTAHTYHSCHQSEKIVVRLNGEVILETIYKPESDQPRAYLKTKAQVTSEDGITYLDI